MNRLAPPQLTRPENPALVLTCASSAVLVSYGYLVGLWTDQHDSSLWPLDLLRTWIARPFGLGEDFGPLGVLLLLAASGYALASGARAGRVLVPFLLATLIAFVLAPHGAWVSGVDGGAQPGDLLGNLTFLSHVVTGVPLLVPVAWTVLLVLLAWGATWLVGRIPERHRWIGYLAQLVVALDLVVLADVLPSLERAATLAAFFPLVVVGQLVHATRNRVLPGWAGVGLAVVAYAVVALADQLLPTMAGWWYPVAATYAGLLFAVAALFAGRTAARIAAVPAVRWTAERSWWLLLFVGPVGHPLLSAFADLLPLGLAVLLALVGTAVVIEVPHRLTEFALVQARRKVSVS